MKKYLTHNNNNMLGVVLYGLNCQEIRRDVQNVVIYEGKTKIS